MPAFPFYSFLFCHLYYKMYILATKCLWWKLCSTKPLCVYIFNLTHNCFKIITQPWQFHHSVEWPSSIHQIWKLQFSKHVIIRKMFISTRWCFWLQSHRHLFPLLVSFVHQLWVHEHLVSCDKYANCLNSFVGERCFQSKALPLMYSLTGLD